MNYICLSHLHTIWLCWYSCFALSPDAKIVLAGYETKKGLICYSSESGEIIWTKKLKNIMKVYFDKQDKNEDFEFRIK